jgi:hypothetical protein
MKEAAHLRGERERERERATEGERERGRDRERDSESCGGERGVVGVMVAEDGQGWGCSIGEGRERLLFGGGCDSPLQQGHDERRDRGRGHVRHGPLDFSCAYETAGKGCDVHSSTDIFCQGTHCTWDLSCAYDTPVGKGCGAVRPDTVPAKMSIGALDTDKNTYAQLDVPRRPHTSIGLVASLDSPDPSMLQRLQGSRDPWGGWKHASGGREGGREGYW